MAFPRPNRAGVHSPCRPWPFPRPNRAGVHSPWLAHAIHRAGMHHPAYRVLLLQWSVLIATGCIPCIRSATFATAGPYHTSCPFHYLIVSQSVSQSNIVSLFQTVSLCHSTSLSLSLLLSDCVTGSDCAHRVRV